MKIRIKGNHLRFRLRQYDVVSLNKNGMVTERIEFGETEDQQISFALCNSTAGNIRIEYEKNKVSIYIPNNTIAEWMNTERVGIEAELDTGKNRIVSVLIEKDFACLDASEEDNEGTYPNPLANCEV